MGGEPAGSTEELRLKRSEFEMYEGRSRPRSSVQRGRQGEREAEGDPRKRRNHFSGGAGSHLALSQPVHLCRLRPWVERAVHASQGSVGPALGQRGRWIAREVLKDTGSQGRRSV